MKFRKKPVVIEAVQWDVTLDAESAIEAMGCRVVVRSDNPDCIIIETLEGNMQANPWDWIIKGVKGEFYPCNPDIFEATYEAVDEAPKAPVPS